MLHCYSIIDHKKLPIDTLVTKNKEQQNDRFYKMLFNKMYFNKMFSSYDKGIKSRLAKEIGKGKFLKKLTRLPIIIICCFVLICIYGFVVLYSAAGQSLAPWAYRQMMIFITFLPVSFFIAFIDIRTIVRFVPYFYFLVLILLISVSVFGIVSMGARRWISFGLFNIQPSEITKIAIVLMLAWYFHSIESYKISKIKYLIIPLSIFLIPMFFVLKQPDLGTAMIIFVTSGIMLFAVGINIKYFIFASCMFLASMPIIWFMLHDYQRTRILTFLNPQQYPMGAGYNIIQSKIAIGSGGIFGKGLFNGTQSHLRFLPEYQTDFIFAFLAEELGFVGGILLLILYLIIIFKSLATTINCSSIFIKLMIIGVVSILFSHVFVNVAMVLGILPVVGIPLPLISYGGTTMVSNLIGFGLIMNGCINYNLKH